MRRTHSEGETLMDQIRATKSHYEQKKATVKDSEARIDSGLGKPSKRKQTKGGNNVRKRKKHTTNTTR